MIALLSVGLTLGACVLILMGHETLTARDWRTGLVPPRPVHRTVQAYGWIALGIVGLLVAAWWMA